jgi:hypothetical protein
MCIRIGHLPLLLAVCLTTFPFAAFVLLMGPSLLTGTILPLMLSILQLILAFVITLFAARHAKK